MTDDAKKKAKENSRFSLSTMALNEQDELIELAGISTDEAAYVGYDSPLNEAQERYCQLRAQGFTKTKAAAVTWPNMKHPGQYAYLIEKKLVVKERIIELKDERKEISDNIDLTEQIRKYHDIYTLCMAHGKVALAMKALERLDALAGFDIKRSENTKITKTSPLNDGEAASQEDLKKFSDILSTHGERPKHQH
jgi:hypothetical protein